MRESSPPIESRTIYATLQLVARKTDKVLSTFPVDAERVTFGRDYDCDVRIYAADVSKLHAEVLVDTATGAASLVVHGQNGVVYTTAGGRPETLKPAKPDLKPIAVVLGDGDTFLLRKKQWRFTYGEPPSLPAYMSPAPKRARESLSAPPSQPTPARRASMRLSIVPSGKRFMPMPSPAMSRVHGLGLSMTPATSGQSPLTIATHGHLGDEEEEHEELLHMAEGEEGDKLYLERKEESDEESDGEHENGHGNTPTANPFVVSTFESRMVSVVPETLITPPDDDDEDDNDGDKVPEEVPEEPPILKSPRSVPLPPASVDERAASTPTTPQRSIPSTPPVPARLAYSTPRGSDSLRKSLLLRSARRRWEVNHMQGIDGAEAHGFIETRRRKSWSPRNGSPRKSLSPAEVPPPPSDSSSSEEEGEDEEEDDDEDDDEDGEYEFEREGSDKENGFQWVYENGQADGSQLDDSDSDRESLDIDVSIPGLSVIDFHAPAPDPSDSEEEEEEEEDEEGEEDEEADPVETRDWSPNSEEERAINQSHSSVEADEFADDNALIEALPEGDDEADFKPVLVTPGPRAASLPGRFYTPQPPRNALGGPRMSLAGIGGPAVRATRLISPKRDTPTGTLVPPTPGRLGKPVRAARTPKREPSVEINYTPPPVTPPRNVAPAPRTPGTGLTQRQRDKLATPRALPEPPMSFRNPVKDQHPLTNLMATPTHHALASPPSLPSEEAQVPHTPMDDIKRRLGALRLKSASAKRQSVGASANAGSNPHRERRATVGFALPETPTHGLAAGRQAPYTARRAPATPRVDPIDEGESESLPPTPTGFQPDEGARMLFTTSTAVSQADDDDADEAAVVAEVTPKRSKRLSPATPSYAGLRDMLTTKAAPRTPALDGVRQLLQPAAGPSSPELTGVRELMAEPRVPTTPSLAGVKDLFRTKAAGAATPRFTGMREMFAERPAPQSPGMDGVREMYEEEEEGTATEVAGPVVDAEPVAEPISPVAAAPALRRPSRLPTASSRRAVSGPAETTTTKRGTRSRGAADAIADAPTASDPALARRTRSHDVPATVPEATVSEPVRSTRTTRGKSVAPSEPAEEPAAASAATIPASGIPSSRSARTSRSVSAPTRRTRGAGGEAAETASTSTRNRQALTEAAEQAIPRPVRTTRRKTVTVAMDEGEPVVGSPSRSKKGPLRGKARAPTTQGAAPAPAAQASAAAPTSTASAASRRSVRSGKENTVEPIAAPPSPVSTGVAARTRSRT